MINQLQEIHLAELEFYHDARKKRYVSLAKVCDDIRTFSEKEDGLITDLADFNAQVEAKESAVMGAVSDEYESNDDGKPKPKFSNESKRAIEQRKRLALDTGYIALIAKRKGTGQELGTARREREYLERIYKLNLAQMRTD